MHRRGAIGVEVVDAYRWADITGGDTVKSLSNVGWRKALKELPTSWLRVQPQIRGGELKGGMEEEVNSWG